MRQSLLKVLIKLIVASLSPFFHTFRYCKSTDNERSPKNVAIGS